MPAQEIEELKNCFVNELLPLRVYLFGSYADGTYTDESDFDFYIVVKDEITREIDEALKAYTAIQWVKRRAVDILVGTESKFEKRKNFPSIEYEVYRKGVLLYDAGKNAGSEQMD